MANGERHTICGDLLQLLYMITMFFLIFPVMDGYLNYWLEHGMKDQYQERMTCSRYGHRGELLLSIECYMMNSLHMINKLFIR